MSSVSWLLVVLDGSRQIEEIHAYFLSRENPSSHPSFLVTGSYCGAQAGLALGVFFHH